MDNCPHCGESLKVQASFPKPPTRYVVAHYDGFDNEWMTLTDPISLDEATAVWKEKTDDGSRNTAYRDIDYYKIWKYQPGVTPEKPDWLK